MNDSSVYLRLNELERRARLLTGLERLEVVPPLRLEQLGSQGTVLSLDDGNATLEALAAFVRIVNSTPINGYYDGLLQIRNTEIPLWMDDNPVWVLDLAETTSISIVKPRYPAIYAGLERGGPYYIAMLYGSLHLLNDTTFWMRLVTNPTQPIPNWISGVFQAGQLVFDSGFAWLQTINGSTGTVPGTDSDWLKVDLNNKQAFNGSETYAPGDYVQETRPTYGIRSSEPATTIVGGGSGVGPYIWAACLVNDTIVQVLDSEHIVSVKQLAVDTYLVTMDLNFGSKDHYSISGTVGDNDSWRFVREGSTGTAFIIKTLSGTAPDGYFDVQVHGKIGVNLPSPIIPGDTVSCGLCKSTPDAYCFPGIATLTPATPAIVDFTCDCLNYTDSVTMYRGQWLGTVGLDGKLQAIKQPDPSGIYSCTWTGFSVPTLCPSGYSFFQVDLVITDSTASLRIWSPKSYHIEMAYAADLTGLDCLADIVMTRTSGLAAVCSNWPSTITISPYDCALACSEYYCIDFTGIANQHSSTFCVTELGTVTVHRSGPSWIQIVPIGSVNVTVELLIGTDTVTVNVSDNGFFGVPALKFTYTADRDAWDCASEITLDKVFESSDVSGVSWACTWPASITVNPDPCPGTGDDGPIISACCPDGLPLNIVVTIDRTSYLPGAPESVNLVNILSSGPFITWSSASMSWGAVSGFIVTAWCNQADSEFVVEASWKYNGFFYTARFDTGASLTCSPFEFTGTASIFYNNGFENIDTGSTISGSLVPGTAVPPTSSPGGFTPTPALVGHWPANEGTGIVINDTSGNVNHIQGGISPTWDADTPGTQAGSGGCVEMSNATVGSVGAVGLPGLPMSNEPITFNCWYKLLPQVPLEAPPHVSLTYADVRYAQFLRDQDNPSAYLSNIQGIISAPPTGNAWHMFTVTIAADGAWNVYTDGSLRDTGTIIPQATSNIGDRLTLTGKDSRIKDIRIYNYILTPTAIAGLGGLWCDTFTGTNGTAITLHSPEIGGIYNAQTGTMNISSNRLHPATYSGGISSCWFDIGSVLSTASVVFNFTAGAGQTMNVGVRYNSSTQAAIWIQLKETGAFRMFEGILGGGVSLLDSDTFVPTAGTEYTLSITDDGSAVAATINSTTINGTTSFQNTATKASLRWDGSSTGHYYDNLEVNGGCS